MLFLTSCPSLLPAPNDPFAALCGQLAPIKRSMDAIARNREAISQNGKSGFIITGQEIKAMPEHIRNLEAVSLYNI